jgi:hypothetical protein
MNEHTPGPWTYKLDNDSPVNFEITTAHAPTSIVSGCGCCDSPWVSSEADARLIAAAPELLEALEEIVKEYYENPDNGRTLRWAIDGAKEAIAKAKGEKHE